MSLYGTSAVSRLSKAQAAELDEHLLAIAEEERPNSVRGLYYMAMGAGLVDKDGNNTRSNYMRIQRRLLQLRRDGRMPYGWITDGTRTVYGFTRYDGPEEFAFTSPVCTARTTGRTRRCASRCGSRRTLWRAS